MCFALRRTWFILFTGLLFPICTCSLVAERRHCSGISITMNTSSTAEGGGGSFKDRKPIGEIGCGESLDGRANPLMDRKVVGVSGYLSICLSIYLPIYLSTYLSIYPSIYLFVVLSICLILPFYLAVYLSIYLSIHLSIYLPVDLSTCLPVFLSVHLSAPSICQSISLSVFLSTYVSVYLQAWKRSYSARLDWNVEVESSKTNIFSRRLAKFHK